MPRPQHERRASRQPSVSHGSRSASRTASRTASRSSSTASHSNTVQYAASKSSARLGRHSSRISSSGGASRSHTKNRAASEEEEERFAVSWYSRTTTTAGDVARATMAPLVINAFVYALVVVMVVVMCLEAPARITTTFGPEMDKGLFQGLVIGALGLFNLVNLLPTYVARHVWCWSCVANSDYWLATPERERDTVVFLTRVTVWAGIFFNVFVGTSACVTLFANRRLDRSPNEVDIALQIASFVVFLVSLAVLAWRLTARFKENRYASVPSDALCA